MAKRGFPEIVAYCRGYRVVLSASLLTGAWSCLPSTRRRSMSRRSSNQAIVEVLGRAELRFRSELDLASLDLDFIDRFRSRGRAPLHLASRHIETRSLHWAIHLVTIS